VLAALHLLVKATTAATQASARPLSQSAVAAVDRLRPLGLPKDKVVGLAVVMRGMTQRTPRHQVLSLKALLAA
jgi:hypothetical protein